MNGFRDFPHCENHRALGGGKQTSEQNFKKMGASIVICERDQERSEGSDRKQNKTKTTQRKMRNKKQKCKKQC